MPLALWVPRGSGAMADEFIQYLTPQSTVADLPAYAMTLDVDRRGKELGRLFERDPDLPGVVITEGPAVRSVLSRGQYFRLVSRNFGHEVFDPRPIQLMLDTLEAGDRPLIMGAERLIQEALSEALNRPKALIYEPIIVRANGSDDGLGVVDFPDLLRADSRITTLRNRQMEQILATLDEGLLMVDPDFRIGPEYSASIDRIFRTESLAGQRLPDFLRPYLGQPLAELCQGYLETLFNPNVIENLVADINPLLNVEATLPGREIKHLRFRFVRAMGSKTIRHILVKVEDISREVELDRERRAGEALAKERVDLVFEVLGADSHHLSDFLAKLERGLSFARGVLDQDLAAMPEALDRLYRWLHGLKGEAGLVGLPSCRRKIHRVEDRLAQIEDRSNPSLEAITALSRDLSGLGAMLDEIRDAVDQLGRLQTAGGKGVSQAVETPGPSDVAEAARNVDTPQLPPIPGATSADAASSAKPTNGAQQAQAAVLSGIGPWVETLSAQLGKPARFYTKVQETDIPEPYKPVLREILIQLIRNSLVHGLENPEQRQGAGKPAVGTLQLALRRHEDRGQVELIFQDDGKGLDLARIRRRAEELGLQARSPAEALPLIFAAGFSTARITDLEAGRGIGLDLVKSRIEACSGSIIPHSEPGAYCAFQILLPLQPSLPPRSEP